ncbi:response regulator transcription factor [Bacillus sp. BGMRC 2118]|nr:response regulator transcription factor [Bacillus sp. BGMRC 2118]
MIKVMIAEDERLAREELEYLLQQEKDIQLLPSASNGKELVELVDKYDPHVVFLDIQMPELGGTKAAALLRTKENGGPLIVFCTAYQDFALEAFGLNALDYLLKPYDVKRLHESLNRIRNRLRHLHSKIHATTSDQVLIDEGDTMVVLPTSDIVYAEKEDKFLKIYTNKRVLTSRMSMQHFEQLLNNKNFLRPHRSYIVNMNYVTEIRPWFNGAYNMIVNYNAETIIPIPRTMIKSVLSAFKSSH